MKKSILKGIVTCIEIHGMNVSETAYKLHIPPDDVRTGYQEACDLGIKGRLPVNKMRPVDRQSGESKSNARRYRKRKKGGKNRNGFSGKQKRKMHKG